MRQRWLCSLILITAWITPAQGQPVVQITEIAPHTLDHEDEWFEFSITGAQTVDLGTWQVSNGQATPKNFTDHVDKFLAGSGAAAETTPLNFSLSQTGYFAFSPSPLALPNAGGTVQILDGSGSLLSEITYPAAKSSSTQAYEQREVWNWSAEHQRLLPQLVRAPATASAHHTRGGANTQLPTPVEAFTLLINEASPDNSQQDFIEIFVADGPDSINLQYTELKHNGTVLWRFDQPFLVSPGDYLVFRVGTPDVGIANQKPAVFHANAKTGLSAGSGTVELIGLSDTSLETRLDALCWKDQNLSQTEQSRVDKFIAQQDWQGECVEIKNLIKNESVARTLNTTDTNSENDFFRHFNGSAGAENQPQNQNPTAVITLQGSKQTVKSVPFFLNVTGQDSTDPDGTTDIAHYEWSFDHQIISHEANPSGFYVEKVGEFELQLTVIDHSGSAHTTKQLIVGLPPGRNSSPSGSAKAKAAVVEKLVKDSLKPTSKNLDQNNDFFAPFLARTDWTQQMVNRPPPVRYPAYEVLPKKTEKAPLYQAKWPRKINIPEPVRQRARKNLGVIFSWREAPWPGLAAEWSAVVAAHQTSEHFAAGYLGF